jgi:hypothetical protein
MYVLFFSTLHQLRYRFSQSELIFTERQWSIHDCRLGPPWIEFYSTQTNPGWSWIGPRIGKNPKQRPNRSLDTNPEYLGFFTGFLVSLHRSRQWRDMIFALSFIWKRTHSETRVSLKFQNWTCTFWVTFLLRWIEGKVGSGEWLGIPNPKLGSGVLYFGRIPVCDWYPLTPH